MRILTVGQIDPHAVGLWASPGGIFAVFLSAMGYLPVIIGSLAGIAAIVFYVTSALDTDLMKARRRARHEKRRVKKIAKLQYKQTVVLNALGALGALTKTEQKVEAGQITTNTSSDNSLGYPKSTPSG